MKKLILVSAIFFSATFYKAEAQFSVNINIGNQPIWGPVGYDYVDYYYLPDMDVYYSVPLQEFIYFDFDRWVFAASLPPRFGRYDLFNCYKVVVNDRDPWLRHSFYRSQYAGYRGHYQPIIRDSREQKYFVIRNHPEHDRYYNNQRPVYNNNNHVENRANDEHRNERWENRRNGNWSNDGTHQNTRFENNHNDNNRNNNERHLDINRGDNRNNGGNRNRNR